jgi:hypothetical protein
MAIPLSLSEVPDVDPYVQYVATSGQTVFPYPFPITQDSDLVVVYNGITWATDNGYSLSGQGNDTGGNMTLSTGATAGDIITLYRDIAIERITQFAQNSGFSSAAFNAEFNNLYLIAQQLETQIGQCLQLPNTNYPAPVTSLTPANYAGKYLAFDSYGNPTPGVLTSSGSITQGIIGSLLYPQTTLEKNASVVPVNLYIAPGIPERYGAVGDGVTDDTQALTNCIASNDTIVFTQDKIYGVQTITFPFNGPHLIDFNGACIRGIATTATNAVVVFAATETNVYNYYVDGNFSQYYLCGTWWYNANYSAQYNVFFGMNHTYFGGVQTASGTTVRAMIYGALVGNSSTGEAQSENSIHGWRTRGCQNPFYSNHANGVLHMTDPIFVCLAEEWPETGGTPNAPWSYANGRALEVVNGIVNCTGGEIQFASSGITVAAELYQFRGQNMIIEIAAPLRINGTPTNGDGVRFDGGRILQDALQPTFIVATGASGVLALSDMFVLRPSGTGAFDNNVMIDCSDTTEPFEVLLNDTESYEYRWIQSGADVRIVKPGSATTVRYRNHRMNMTAADTNVYMLNTFPTDSMLEGVGFDRLGYTTTGWTLTQITGSGSTMSATTNTGPTGYNAAQLTLTAASSYEAQATYGNPGSQADLQGSALHVAPGELYWVSCWANLSTGSTGTVIADCYKASGSGVGATTLADSGSIPQGSWKFIEMPFVVPALTAYVCFGVRASTGGAIEITDLRVRRAS